MHFKKKRKKIILKKSNAFCSLSEKCRNELLWAKSCTVSRKCKYINKNSTIKQWVRLQTISARPAGNRLVKWFNAAASVHQLLMQAQISSYPLSSCLLLLRCCTGNWHDTHAFMVTYWAIVHIAKCSLAEPGWAQVAPHRTVFCLSTCSRGLCMATTTRKWLLCQWFPSSLLFPLSLSCKNCELAWRFTRAWAGRFTDLGSRVHEQIKRWSTVRWWCIILG